MQENKYPLVTIGIPTYNRSNLIQQTLQSALDQDYPNLEIIISDNASTDNTAEICKSFCKLYSNFTYFRQISNRGGAENFNILLEMAKGSYFMWLGDDDWIDKNYITECMKVLTMDPDAVIVAGQVKYYGINDRYLYTGIIMNFQADCKKQRVREYFLKVKHNGIFYGVMPKELIARYCVNNYLLGGDLLIVASLLFSGKGYTLETCSLHRRRGGMSSDIRKMAKTISLSGLDYHLPRVAVAKNLFQHILSDPAFKELSLFSKYLLAVQCILNAFTRKAFSVLFKKRFIEQSGSQTRKS